MSNVIISILLRFFDYGAKLRKEKGGHPQVGNDLWKIFLYYSRIRFFQLKIYSTELQGHINSLPIFAINVYSGTLVYSENTRKEQYK